MTGPIRRNRIYVLLCCKHQLLFDATTAPIVGDAVYCFKCQRMQVVDESRESYSVRCLDCKRGTRQPGTLGRIGAEAFAARHHTLHPTHTVVVKNGDMETARFAPQREMLLPSNLDKPVDPPF